MGAWRSRRGGRGAGPWDCESRDEVMALLRLRESRRPADQAREMRVTRRDHATFLVSGLGGSDGTATMLTIAGGKVIAMQQVRAEPRDADADADAAVAALRAGDLVALSRVLDSRPDLARERVPGYGGRTLLHVVADWPGFTPHGPEVVCLLVERGANPNVRGDDDEHGESPLHSMAGSSAQPIHQPGRRPQVARTAPGTLSRRAFGC